MSTYFAGSTLAPATVTVVDNIAKIEEQLFAIILHIYAQHRSKKQKVEFESKVMQIKLSVSSRHAYFGFRSTRLENMAILAMQLNTMNTILGPPNGLLVIGEKADPTLNERSATPCGPRLALRRAFRPQSQSSSAVSGQRD